MIGKYIVIEGKHVIPFETELVHYEVAGKQNVTSAGFFIRDKQHLMAYGESISLGVGSKPGDAVLLENFFEVS